VKENVAYNEEFCQFHINLEANGVSYPEIRKQAIKRFAKELSNGKEKTPSEIKHSYRATVDRLANPNKYGGKYTYMSRFQYGKKPPVVIPTQA